MKKNMDLLCINTLRMLAADMVESAQSGHPGTPMGIAPLAHVLWTKYLKFNPSKPNWPDRDRFILSNGHASTLLYSLLHLFGFGLSVDDLKQFRQLGSKTPGHPERHITQGVEITTGPLGQGLSSGVGMAIAEKRLAAEFNKSGSMDIVDHFTYVFCSDGDLMEGVTSEASSIAGCLKLGKLICLYDDNSVTIEGPTKISFREDVAKRYEAYGWYVQQVEDVNNMEAVEKAIEHAREETEKPSIILVKSIIGYGSPARQGKSSAHFGAFGEEELKAIKATLGWEYKHPYTIPEEVYEYYRSMILEKVDLYSKWESKLNTYAKKYPLEAKEFLRRFSGELPAGWEKNLPTFVPDQVGKPTRMANGEIINAIAGVLPELIGGSADLAPNTQTLVNESEDFSAENILGRNIHFGVREHAMAAIANGISLHGGYKPYTATFLVFSDYMRPSLRLGALTGASPIHLLTNDSIALGEDGPTHQPIEHLTILRATPNLTLIRPCDHNETVQAWKYGIENSSGPTCISLSRQPLPILDREKYGSASGLQKGAYVISESSQGKTDVIIIASGSEVSLALAAQRILEDQNIHTRVVSMPSWEIFRTQSDEYQQSVLPDEVVKRVSVEAASSLGWERWVGRRGLIIAVDEFGVSGKSEDVLEKFGFTVKEIVRSIMKYCKDKSID